MAHACKGNRLRLIFLVAAILLSFERIAYVWVSRHPESFRKFCARSIGSPSAEPTTVLRRVFYLFKTLQVSVFLGWCYHFGHGSFVFVRQNLVPLVVGVTLIAAGQTLNFGVFYRLGIVGVFYGNLFGREIPQCRQFPFSFLDHPQYLGAAVSIWGFFIAMRFPQPDWYLLPVLETVYYSAGARLER
jgi:phosphatidyl-N-methylethanolamine N-methyltransferase